MSRRKNVKRTLNHIVSAENALIAELPKLLAWEDGLIGRIAQRIDDTWDWELLPVLADALEDAGCTVQAVLDHLRAGDSHAIFCYVTQEILRAYRPHK